MAIAICFYKDQAIMSGDYGWGILPGCGTQYLFALPASPTRAWNHLKLLDSP